jgi:hypothetical protein
MKGDVNPVAGVIVEQLENFMSTSNSYTFETCYHGNFILTYISFLHSNANK